MASGCTFNAITRFDGAPVDSDAHIILMVSGTKPGTQVIVEFLRDGRSESVSLTIGSQ